MFVISEHPPENLPIFTFDGKTEAGSPQQETNDRCGAGLTALQDGERRNSKQAFYVGQKNSCIAGLLNGIAFSAMVWTGIVLLI